MKTKIGMKNQYSFYNFFFFYFCVFWCLPSLFCFLRYRIPALFLTLCVRPSGLYVPGFYISTHLAHFIWHPFHVVSPEVLLACNTLCCRNFCLDIQNSQNMSAQNSEIQNCLKYTILLMFSASPNFIRDHKYWTCRPFCIKRVPLLVPQNFHLFLSSWIRV